MKWLAGFWGFPVLFLFAWYGLSYNDMSFGIFMLSREAHDLVFKIYGDILGIPPETIPPLVARAIIVDSLIVLAIYVFRRRLAFWNWGRSAQPSVPTADIVRNESLSSAP